MSDAQTTDAALCILAGLIARQLPMPAQLAADLYESARHFSSHHELSALLNRLGVEVENTFKPTYPET